MRAQRSRATANAPDRKGAADDGLDADFLGRDRELEGAEEVGPIGDGDGRHALPRRELPQGVGAGRSLQEGVGRTHPEVNESVPDRHPYFPIPSTLARPAWARDGART